MSKQRKKKEHAPTARDIMKMETAQELGLWDKIQRDGWESLTNAECGRVGGIMRKKIKEMGLGEE